MRLLLIVALALALVPFKGPEGPVSRLIFPLQPKHNHGSCVIELPNGDLLACWYTGSGERSADDVQIVGARLRKGANAWSEPFLMADTPGFPDCNPCMILDQRNRLWLFWPAILDNRWESALLKYRSSADFQQRNGPPRWDRDGIVHLKPGPEFQQAVERDLRRMWEPYLRQAESEQKPRLETYLSDNTKSAADKLSVRLGWMPRVHPFLDGKRMILPLYSDRFDFSLMALTDDGGRTWRTSAPLVGPGNVQPSIVKRKDGTLVAFFRDNGPPPNRVMISESTDRGESWSTPRDTELVDTGAGVEAISLKSGRWTLVNNDTERGRHRLAVSISEDEGRTWPRKRYLENDPEGESSGSYSYPSVIQARNGIIHVTYSCRPPRDKGTGSSIKHASFHERWLMQP